MIAYLAGTVLWKTPQEAVLDVGGVGYRVFITFNGYEKLPGKGQPAQLHVVTIAREDALHLYGFCDLAEKEMFLKLITVSRIGPRLACSILSGTKVDALRNAIVSQDKASFSKIPGVGPKTAERLILELKDKFDDDISAPTVTGKEADIADAVTALVNLGYQKAQAHKAVTKASTGNEKADLGGLIRDALKVLSG